MDKRFSEQQFCKLHLLCRNSRAVTLAQPGLTAGWLAGWLANRRNAGKCHKFLKFIINQIFILFAALNEVTPLLKQ